MAKRIKTRKAIRKRSRKNKSKRNLKGGCGCTSTLYTGGNINPVSFNGSLPIRYYYEQNNYENYPNIENARNLPDIKFVGGKKSKKILIKRNKKMIGGDMLLGNAYSNNPLVSFGTTEGATTSANLLFGSSSLNPSIYDQPALKGFNNFNLPLA